jgi:hypothetical protein
MEEHPSLSKIDITQIKTLTKSLTKRNFNSPVKHTISSLNKSIAKEITQIENQNKPDIFKNGIITKNFLILSLKK